MNQLDQFLSMLCGHFDNQEQLDRLKAQGDTDYPFARHVNTVCNDKMNGLPEHFKGAFVLEESYYTINGAVNKMPHLFLVTEEPDGIQLVSYEMPEGYTKENFTYDNVTSIAYKDLKKSEKFNPILYKWEKDSFSENPSVCFHLC